MHIFTTNCAVTGRFFDEMNCLQEIKVYLKFGGKSMSEATFLSSEQLMSPKAELKHERKTLVDEDFVVSSGR